MNYLAIFVALTIITAPKPIVETKSIDNGHSVNESNNQISLANNSINNNSFNPENIASRETINHVRHQHRQQIGNVQIITEIDIKNLVTLLNVTTVNATQLQIEPKRPDYAISTADETKDSPINMDQMQFKRLDRHQNGDYKPFKFPEQQTMHSRRVRWPSDDAIDIDIASKSNVIPSHKSLIRFPDSELVLEIQNENENENGNENQNQNENENGLQLPENNNKPFEFTANDPNLTAIRPLTTPSSSSSSTLNIFNDFDHNENWIVNQTAIDNGFEPFIYIDDGIFKVKYVRKGDNMTTATVLELRESDLNNNNNNSTSSTSINPNVESAIIFNDERFPTKSKYNYIDPTPTNAQPMNNTIHSSNGLTTTKGTSLPVKENGKPKQPQTQLNSARKPRPLKDGLPIFV